jgi:hypothetical protein
VSAPPGSAQAMQLAGQQPQPPPGGHPVMLHPQQIVQVLSQVLVESPGLAGQLAAMGVPGAASDPQTAINAICQNPCANTAAACSPPSPSAAFLTINLLAGLPCACAPVCLLFVRVRLVLDLAT